MPAHRDMQAAFCAGLATGAVPPGVTAVGDVARRFSVYRNTVAHSLTDALCQRFPTVLRIVGEDFFKATARVFIADHPPWSAILQAYGADFPDFLAHFPPAANLPYLPDVARIEVLRGAAYHAADATPVTAQTIREAFAAGPERLHLNLHPSLRVLASDHRVATIWAMNQPGATPRRLTGGPEAALIFRQGETVPVLSVDADTARTVVQLLTGTSLGEACADIPPETAGQTLAILIQHGLITQVTHN